VVSKPWHSDKCVCNNNNTNQITDISTLQFTVYASYTTSNRSSACRGSWEQSSYHTIQFQFRFWLDTPADIQISTSSSSLSYLFYLLPRHPIRILDYAHMAGYDSLVVVIELRCNFRQYSDSSQWYHILVQVALKSTLCSCICSCAKLSTKVLIMFIEFNVSDQNA